MKAKWIVVIGGIFIFISQVLMSFGYDFLMAQRPIDYAHWSLLIGAVLMFGLWFSLPESVTKSFGLSLMSIGIAGVAGMCVIDFMLWAAHDNQELKNSLFQLISSTPAIHYPFLVIGSVLFYSGISISTLGLYRQSLVAVLLVNLGTALIGLGFMVLRNPILPAIGGFLLFLGLVSLLKLPAHTKQSGLK
ncbi:MAG: hypothetical protein AAFR14_05525 [Bacteroidota bacterium]